MAERLSLYATASRGTEALLADELGALGAVKVKQDRGGVRFFANLREALRVCLWTRIGMRVLLPLGEAEAKGKDGLYEATQKLPWEEHLTARSTFAVEASVRDSELTHSGFVALRIKDAIVDRLREKLGQRPDVAPKNPDVQVVARLAKDQLSLSLDLCGAPLYKRGLRLESVKAPVNECLAAAVLAAAGYVGEEPLFDPMCGSGTFLLEGALIATRRAPSRDRRFSIERWPSHASMVRPLLEELRAEAKALERPAPCFIGGLDKSADAVRAARKNASAARLGARLSIQEGDATQAGPPEGPGGLLVTNPPYGERLEASGGQKGMKSFYFKLGEALAGWTSWRLAVLAGNPAFESAFHQKPQRRLALWNGPLQCHLLVYSPRVGLNPRPFHT